MSEPFYVRQNGEFSNLTPGQRRSWFKGVAQEAKEEGATICRASVDDENQPTMGLVEGWKEHPKEQGPIRWALMANKEHSK